MSLSSLLKPVRSWIIATCIPSISSRRSSAPALAISAFTISAFASQLLQDGASLAYVRDQLGHSSISVTVDLYGHLVPSANIAWVDRLDRETSQQQNATPAQLGGGDEQDVSLEVLESNGGPGQSRTADLRFRKPLLYPSELRGRLLIGPIIS